MFRNRLDPVHSIHLKHTSLLSRNANQKNSWLDTQTRDAKIQPFSTTSIQSENPINQAILFSILMIVSGACLGPFLDSYHSAFGVLQYNSPLSVPWLGLITTWWVPFLFGLAGFIIGWLYILLDSYYSFDSDKEYFESILPFSSSTTSSTATRIVTSSSSSTTTTTRSNRRTNLNCQEKNPPEILTCIAFFTFQYWLSGYLFAHWTDTMTLTMMTTTILLDPRSILFLVMVIFAGLGFYIFDRSIAGFIASLSTAIGGPCIEAVLLSLSSEDTAHLWGYHYTDLGETGLFPLWIVPVYFLGGPAVGNLARGFWNGLSR